MIYIIAIQAIALAVCLYYIGRLWFSRRDERSRADSHADSLARRANPVEALKASEARLRALLHEAAGLLMDERHRSKPRKTMLEQPAVLLIEYADGTVETKAGNKGDIYTEARNLIEALCYENPGDRSRSDCGAPNPQVGVTTTGRAIAPPFKRDDVVKRIGGEA